MGMKIDLKSKMSSPSPALALSAMLGGGGGREGEVVQIDLEGLVPYPDQPFRPYSQQKLEELAEDIGEHGVLSPVIVRPMGSQYQILAGHNRCAASRLAGLTKVPCVVKDVDDSQAELIMLSTNLQQRQLLPSEKAWAYRRQVETLAARKEAGAGLETVAQQNEESRRTISYYIRLTYLKPAFLELVDQKELPTRAGVELSYLTEDTQTRLLEYLQAYPKKISLKEAEALREASAGGQLTRTEIENLLCSSTKRFSEKASLRFDKKELESFFPGKTQKEIQREVLEILKTHFQSRQLDNG